MSILELRTFRDSSEVLSKSAEIVSREEIASKDFQEFIDSMIETCRSLNALGLAAPQVGVSKRVFVVRRDKLSDEFDVFINPKIVLRKEKITHHGEACLSLPGAAFHVKRFKSVVLDAQDRHGRPGFTKSRTKIQAFAFQHEMDHLDGVLLNSHGEEI